MNINSVGFHPCKRFRSGSKCSEENTVCGRVKIQNWRDFKVVVANLISVSKSVVKNEILTAILSLSRSN